MIRVITLLLGVLLTLMATADTTIYKAVDANGNVVFSDRAPSSEKSETLNYADPPPPPSKLPHLRRYRQESTEQSLSSEMSSGYRQEPTLFIAQWCGYCRMARAYLAEHHIQYRELDIETPDGAREFEEAHIPGSGIPLLLVNGKHYRGFSAQNYDAIFRK